MGRLLVAIVVLAALGQAVTARSASTVLPENFYLPAKAETSPALPPPPVADVPPAEMPPAELPAEFNDCLDPCCPLDSWQSCDAYGSCEDCICRQGLLARWLAAPPRSLPQPCLFQNLGIKAGGWFQGGITANADGPSDGFNATVLTNDRDGEFQMNQLWLYLDRPIDTSRTGFDIGGRIDTFYGTDWRVAAAHSRNWENEFNGEDQLYGLAIPQFYVEAGVGDLSVKAGHMTGILGYEIVPPIGNFFYSHSYALCYAEPILITGVMGKFRYSDRFSVLAGFHRGVGMFEDNNDELNFQGGVVWTGPCERLSIAYGLDTGKADPAAQSDQYLHSLVAKYQVTKKLLYVLQNDLGQADDMAALGGGSAEWYGLNQYLLYAINAKWSVGGRYEWFRDDDGVRVGGLGSLGYRGWQGAGGYAGDFNALTLGLNWKPKANILIRPEARWDWYDGPASPVGPYPLPFNNGADTDQFTVAADLIVTY